MVKQMYPVLYLDHRLIVCDTSGVDALNFAGCLSFDVCRLGIEIADFLEKVKHSSWIMLLSVGGFLMYRSFKPDSQVSITFPINFLENKRGCQNSKFDVYEEDKISKKDVSYFNRCLDFQYASNKDEVEVDDISLNSLSSPASPAKFLKAHERSLDYLKNIAIPKDKLDFNRDYQRLSAKITPQEGNILHRPVLYNKLTHRFYQPGVDLRMSGDGAETNEDGSPIHMSSKWLPPQSRQKTSRYRRRLSESFTSNMSSDDLHINICAQTMSSSMIEMIRNAKATRRLIREISLDSEESELIIDEIAFSANEAEIKQISLNSSFDTHTDEEVWSLADLLTDPSDCYTMLQTRKSSLGCETLTLSHGNLPSNDEESFTDESSSDLYEWDHGWTKEGFLEGKNIRETERQPPSGCSSVRSESILERLQDFSDGLPMANLSV